jgi:ParB family chromosome partitioning protein
MKNTTAPAPNTPAKPKRAAPMDYGAAYESVQDTATQQAEDRFARAERVIQARPTALTAAAPAAGEPAAGEGAASPQALRSVSGATFDVASAAVGHTYNVPLNLVDPNPYSPRHFYKSAQVDKTAISMEQKGQKVPANGFVTPEGRIRLIEGGTRLRSARAIGAATLEVRIEEPPKDDLELYNRAAEFHDERTNHTALDTAMLMRKLLDDGVCQSQDELALKVKVNGAVPSKATVSMYLRISRHVPERLLLQMADHEATSSMRVAYAISSFFTHDDYEKDKDKYETMADEVIQDVISKNLAVRDVESLVKSKLEGPKARQRGENTNVKLGDAKGVIKMFEGRGQLDFSIRGLPADKLTQLKATIEAICAGRTPLAEQGG